MNKPKKVILIVFFIVVALILLFAIPGVDEIEEKTGANSTENVENEVPGEINYSEYSFEFAEGPIVKILEKNIGNNIAYFHLPPTEFIEVARGDSHGIAFALQDIDPNGAGDYFEFFVTPDSSVLENCGVAEAETLSWIKMGRSSFGKLSSDWVSVMVVYFKFPESISPCTAFYNFNLTREGVQYASKQFEFRIL
jgi:hypothetical protein